MSVVEGQDIVTILRGELRDLRAAATSDALAALARIEALESNLAQKQSELDAARLVADLAPALAERNRELEEKDRRLAEATLQIDGLLPALKEKDRKLEEKERQLAEKDNEILAHQDALAARADAMAAKAAAAERFEAAFRYERRRVMAATDALYLEREAHAALAASVPPPSAAPMTADFGAGLARSGQIEWRWPDARWRPVELDWRALAGSVESEDPVRIVSPAKAWDYAAISSPLPRAIGAVEILELVVSAAGPVGIILSDKAGSKLLSEQQVPAEVDRQTLFFELTPQAVEPCILLRNPGKDITTGVVTITSVRLLAESDLDPAQNPALTADRFVNLDLRFQVSGAEGQNEAVPVSLTTPPDAWSYGALSDVIDLETPGLACVEVIALVHDGQVGFGLVTEGGDNFVGPEVALRAQQGVVTAWLTADEAFGRARIVVRNHDAPGQRGTIEILKVRLGFEAAAAQAAADPRP